MEYSVVIPAAGSGKRMKAGKNKQFLELQGELLIVHTLRLFEEDQFCRQIILVANKEECLTMREIVHTNQFKKVTAVIEGGAERQHSVKNGIDVLIEEQIVLIHDGARPFVRHDHIQQLVVQAETSGAATIAVSVKDTIKRVVSGKVIETLDRKELWTIQTPQAFRLSLLREAHEKAAKSGFLGTDDASLVEWLGYDVFITEGDYHNIKLTTPEDLIFAEAIMEERK